MAKKITLWLSKRETDELIDFYNEHHDEIRQGGNRNFDDWIGNMAYRLFTQIKHNGFEKLQGLAEENHPIPHELFDIERSLAHICSDASGLEKNEIAKRIIVTRDGVRNTIRKKGYKGTF